jgi:hypothetical protein
MKRTLTMAIVIALFVTVTVGISTENAKAWSADVWHSPTSATEGTTVTFHITVKNTGSHSMKVTKVGIRFDWMEENYYYFSNNVPQIISSGGESTFDITVPIPKGIPTETYHALHIEIEASDPGWLSEWGIPYQYTYSSSIYVKDSTWGTAPSIGAPLALFSTLLVVSVIYLRKRKETS